MSFVLGQVMNDYFYIIDILLNIQLIKRVNKDTTIVINTNTYNEGCY